MEETLNQRIQSINKKSNRPKTTTILMALTGIAGIIGYYFFVMESPLVQYIKPNNHISREDIRKKAATFSRQLNIESPKNNQKLTAEIDSQLLRYAQYYKKKNHKFPRLTIGYWKTVWKKIEKSHNQAAPEVVFDFNGDLIGFRVSAGDRQDKKNAPLAEDEALMEAKYFLESKNIKTKDLVISQNDIIKAGDEITYRVTLKDKSNSYNDLTNTYYFEIIGARIVEYRRSIIVDPLIPDETGADHLFSMILNITTWIALIIIILTRFAKKIRRDELEFNHAVWVGIGSAVSVFLLIITDMQNIQWEIMIGGGVAGLFSFIGMFILFATAESCAREAWPEKLEVMDLFFQGKVAVHETGTIILKSFFLAGTTLLLWGGLIFAVTTLDIGYIVTGFFRLDPFGSHYRIIHLISGAINTSLFIGFAFFCFLPGYIKNKIPNKKLLKILLPALAINLGLLHFMIFSPGYLGFILMLPTALAWAYTAVKWESLTILLSLFWVTFFFNLALILLTPEIIYTPQVMGVVIFIVLLLGLGIYLEYRPRSVKDYGGYVPEYVSRIAEKERFLKELEIARGVQMRFLPQHVPNFPSLEIVSLCQPAMEVGGDYYDFIRMDERYMSVLIGDVSGKGVSAAFYMTMVKGIIKTLSRITKAPAALLAEANEIFYENAPRNVFITIIYGIFDLESKTLTVASAGHNPLIAWRRRTGKTEIINPKGMAIGLDNGEHYRVIIEEKRIPIEDDDVFVFYTDGITESMNIEEETFGIERLRDIIEKFAHLSPQTLQEKIIHAVNEFSGKAPQHDDLTMVVVKIRPIN